MPITATPSFSLGLVEPAGRAAAARPTIELRLPVVAAAAAESSDSSKNSRRECLLMRSSYAGRDSGGGPAASRVNL